MALKSEGIDILQKCLQSAGVGIHSLKASQYPKYVTILYLFSMPTQIPMQIDYKRQYDGVRDTLNLSERELYLQKKVLAQTFEMSIEHDPINLFKTVFKCSKKISKKLRGESKFTVTLKYCQDHKKEEICNYMQDKSRSDNI